MVSTEHPLETAFGLQKVTVADESGHGETLSVTDEHPFWVDGQGWATAASLIVGNKLVTPDGRTLTVTFNADDYRPEGVTVYNFAAEDAHTYFVADGVGETDVFVWAHNKCISINGPVGQAREAEALDALRARYPGSSIQSERYLRGADGKRLLDAKSGEGRRIDFAVFSGNKLVALVEVTSETARKSLQTAKELRIRSTGSVFIRNRETGELVDATSIVTELMRLP